MLLNRLQRYIEDPNDPIANYELAKEYERLDQHATSCGLFLRSADRTDDADLLYECVVSAARALILHGGSPKTALLLLEKAIQIDSSRPDAYYFIALAHRYSEDENFEQAYGMYKNTLAKSQKKCIHDHIDLFTVEPKITNTIYAIRHSKSKSDYHHKKVEA